ncbi:MAG: methionyl-tRNA formyltransferase [Magnetococcus sp. DMHC-6]
MTFPLPWRLVFMGTPDFAVPTLQALLAGPDQVVGVFTQPDKPVGRGLKMTFSPVKSQVVSLNIPIFQPTRLRHPEAVAQLRALAPDLVVVVAYGQILSQEVLDLPVHGCLNLHASLLPRWRGAAPLQRALLAGDKESGVTIMKMDAGLDTGAMLTQKKIIIPTGMTGGALHDCLAPLGAQLLLETIAKLKTDSIVATPQPEVGVTYAHKIANEEGKIDWNQEARVIWRQILAFNPYPGAYTTVDNKTCKIWQSRLLEHTSAQVLPGSVLALHDDGPEVACGGGSLVLTQIQMAGKRSMPARDWMRGVSLENKIFM